MMKRRSFLKAAAAGLLVFPAAGSALAQTPFAPEDIKVPPRDQLLSTFGWVTDIHYSVQPIRRIENEDSIRVYAHSMAKFRQALDLFNTRDLDFMIELGDFKDCQDNGDREGTLNFLKTIENEYRTFNGPRYHIAGNHDFDKISYSDYLVNTPNYGPANGKSYYSFTFGGVKYIVLDACFNNLKGEHYSEGNSKWTVNMIPDEELAWFKEELGKGSEPIIVMTHQNLNYWAQGPMNNWFINNAKDVVDAMEKSGRVLMHLSGHYHRGWFGTRNGISYVVAKGLVERPLPTNVCGIVSIDKEKNVYVEGFYNETSHLLKKKA